MKQYVINGGIPLAGEVEISGAKNSALGILAAAVMCDEDVTITNLPDVNDINVFLSAIKAIGAKVDRLDRHTVVINGKDIESHVVDNPQIRKIRASYYLIGAFLGKYKEAAVALPGGCKIGSRPIDEHQRGFEALGAKTAIVPPGLIEAKTENGKLIGSKVTMNVVSVGATINVMLAASMAEGTTYIRNAAKEPHVVDVAMFLNKMGANIKGAGTYEIKIKGVEKFHGTEHEIIPDQIEAGTFMCAAAATMGDVLVKRVIPQHLQTIYEKLAEMGADIQVYEDEVRVTANKRLKAATIMTAPHPGFPTDMQSQFGACFALADGIAEIDETIFENRFGYVGELRKMGAQISVNGNVAKITGVPFLAGADVEASDLRAGAALVIAGLAASGETKVTQIQYIQRGYEHFEEKLQALGANIRKEAVVERDDQDDDE